MGKTKEVKVKKSAEAAAPKTVKAAATPSKKSAKVSKKSKKEESSSESESEEESASEASADSEDSDDSESEAEEKPKTKTNGAKAKKEESDSDSDDSDDSADEKEESTDKSDVKKDSDSENDSDDSDESDAEDKKTEEEPSKKRKADDEEPAAAKKAKTEEEGETSSTLFVGNLSWNVDDSVLYDEFKGFDGLTGARVITDRETQRSRGFGYVEFDSVEHAQAAFDKMTGYFLDGRELKIDFSTGRAKSNDANPAASRAKKYGDVTSPESDTLFVGNLSFDADEETVSAFFSEVANVKSLRLPTDMESGRPKGFGYVSFYSLEDSKKAFDTLNGQSCAGRNVRLDYSTPKPRTEFGGDRGGRGGRGRGGGFGGGRGGGGGFGGRGRGGGDRGGRGRGGFGGRGGGGFAGKKTTF